MYNILGQDFLKVYTPIITAGGNAADVANSLPVKITPQGVAKLARICRRQYQDDLAQLAIRKTAGLSLGSSLYLERLKQIDQLVPECPALVEETIIKDEHKAAVADLLDGILDNIGD